MSGNIGRISRVSAVRISLAVDLDRLEEERQTRRGEHCIDTDLGTIDDLDLSGTDVCGRQVQLDRESLGSARRNRRCPTGLPQWIPVEGVEFVRQEQRVKSSEKTKLRDCALE